MSMAKKAVKIHQKSVANRLYQASRLPSGVKNFGSKNIRKGKKS